MDENHLKKLCTYINSNINTRKKYCNFKKGERIEVRTSATKGNIGYLIRKKFDIKDRKTYNPPNIIFYKNFTDNELLAILIGIIDGDGTIYKSVNKKNSNMIKIEARKEWLDFFLFFKELIEKICKDTITNIRASKKNTIIFSLYKFTIISFIKNFIKINNLPALDRKWEKINENFIDNRVLKRNQAIEMRRKGLQCKDIAIKLGYTKEHVSRITKGVK